MKYTSIIAIYFVLWWLCLFMVLPWGIRSATETGEKVVPGNEPGAPVNPRLARKLLYTTILATVLFGGFYWVYLAGWLNIGDLLLPGIPDPSGI